MADLPPEYVLGHSERELERLTVQARLFAPYTEQFLRHAGLRPGMSVLDVGAGHGDVSLLAARLVGPEGRVVALDQSASAVTAIERRAAAQGLRHVRAVQGDLGQARFDTPFDAIIGRFVLMYVPDVTASVTSVPAPARSRARAAAGRLLRTAREAIPASGTQRLSRPPQA